MEGFLRQLFKVMVLHREGEDTQLNESDQALLARASAAWRHTLRDTLDSCHLHCFRKSNDALKQLPRYMEICQDGNGLVGQLRTCVFLLCASSETISLLRAICKSHSEPFGSASTNT